MLDAGSLSPFDLEAPQRCNGDEVKKVYCVFGQYVIQYIAATYGMEPKGVEQGGVILAELYFPFAHC